MKKLGLAILVMAVIWFWAVRRKSTVVNFPNTRTTIVAFGDSLTAGYGAAAGKSYPDYLATKVNRPVVNLGKSGELAVQAPTRLQQVLRHQPYMVLIEFGANDFMQHQSTPAAVAAVAQLVRAVQNAGAIAVIVDTGGPGMGEYTKAYKQLARSTGALFVPEIMKGIFFKPHLKSDQVHPNAAGYEKVAEKVHAVIKKYV